MMQVFNFLRSCVHLWMQNFLENTHTYLLSELCPHCVTLPLSCSEPFPHLIPHNGPDKIKIKKEVKVTNSHTQYVLL